ncbi:MAG: periplasmic heavy metal sensor [Syntrophobacteraceae bacterium]
MGSGCFLLGFATALAIVIVFILVSYYYLKRTRWKNSNIKGYLDLIPDLSDEQRLKVQSIRQTFLPGVERIRQDLCRLRIALAKALFSEPIDRGKVHSIAQEILKCQSQLEQEVCDHIIEEKELLSPRQQKKFFDIILDQFAHGGLGVHDVKPRGKS